jgi:polyphenol oxidase
MKTLIKNWTFGEMEFAVNAQKPSYPLIQVTQVHGIKIAHSKQAQTEADGIIATHKDLASHALAIKTADCLPVALWNQDECALLHLGWRGLQQKLIEQPELKKSWNEAFIGPAIHPCCFEVTSEFKDHFPHSLEFYTSRLGKNYFDLIAECKKQLTSTFPKIKIQDSGICTCCHQEYWSYRRDKTNQRLWNILKIKDDL